MISRLLAANDERNWRRALVPISASRLIVTSAPLRPCMLVIFDYQRLVVCLRREISAFSCQDSDEDVIAAGDLTHKAGDPVVKILGKCIELLGDIESDNGNFALSGQGDGLLSERHCRGSSKSWIFIIDGRVLKERPAIRKDLK